MSIDGWPFEDPPNVAVITTRAIMHSGDWIALVSHDEDDGAWQFLGPGGASQTDEAMVVGLRSVLEKDGSIAELADLPLGWQAWRNSPEAPWKRAPHAD
jgi:hypothetical protein